MSETRHQLRSVSDLYAADEIEVLLLEEIRDLEPPTSAYSRPEDIQDFEIAGSRTGGRISSQSSELDSPGVHSTVHSWDSHANYRGHYGNDHGHGSSSNALPWSRASHIVFYCDIQGHLKTATGVFRLLLLISSIACLATLCSSGTAKVSLFMLPLVGRLRVMIFVAVFCFLITALLLFLDISHVVYLFPFNWTRLNAWIFTGIGLSYVLSSALLALSIWEYHSDGWVPKRTRRQLSVAAGIGLSCAFFAFILSWIHGRSGSTCKRQGSHDHMSNQLYKPVDNSSSSGVTLKERSPKRPTSWGVKNQHSKKRHTTDSDTNINNGNPYDRYKSSARKDHWASARQNFLPDNEDDVVQRVDNELEKRRKKRRKDDENSSTIDGNLSGSKAESAHIVEDGKTRRIPRKLPLQSVERPQPRPSLQDRQSSIDSKQLRNKISQNQGNNDAQSYWILDQSKPIDGTENSLPWDGTANNNKTEEVPTGNPNQTTVWSEQWQPPPDDVQPCSSKTVDPYNFA